MGGEYVREWGREGRDECTEGEHGGGEYVMEEEGGEYVAECRGDACSEKGDGRGGGEYVTEMGESYALTGCREGCGAAPKGATACGADCEHGATGAGAGTRGSKAEGATGAHERGGGRGTAMGGVGA